MSSERLKGRALIGILLVCLVAACLFFLYSQREKFGIPDLSSDKLLHAGKPAGKIRCRVASNVSDGKYLSLALAIPCKDTRQRSDLERKLPRLRHRFLMSMSQPEMEEFIEQRNFEAIRKQLLNIINQDADKPVDTIYFESICYD